MPLFRRHTDRAAVIPVKGTKGCLHGISLALHLAPSVHLSKSLGTSAESTVIVDMWLGFLEMETPAKLRLRKIQDALAYFQI